MINSTLKDFISYVKIVKISWIVLGYNALFILILLLLFPVLPEWTVNLLNGIVLFIRKYILFNIINPDFLDRFIMIFLLAFPSIICTVFTVTYYIKSYNYRCPKCENYIVRHKKVLLAFIPKLECPNCSIKLDIN